MAKGTKSFQEPEGEISVSLVKFTMKGSDASLQKGLDTIKAAFVQAGFAVVPEVRHLRSPQPRQLNGAERDDVEDNEVDEVEDASDVTEVAVAAAPAPRRPPVAKKPPNFKILKELKFDGVKPTLAEFVAEKKPDGHLDRYLCIAYWFKHFKEVEDLTVEHFFTAYMNYQWPLPTNAAGPMRDLRHQRRQLLIAGAAPATSTISNTGESRVVTMGKAEG
jgi:hypothetical protein